MVSKKVVTPVETGVEGIFKSLKYWIPAFAGMTEISLFRLFTKSS